MKVETLKTSRSVVQVHYGVFFKPMVGWREVLLPWHLVDKQPLHQSHESNFINSFELSKFVKDLINTFSIENEKLREKLIVQTFIDLHFNDWFSVGFISYFTDIDTGQIVEILRDEEVFIKSCSNGGYYFSMYTTKKKYESSARVREGGAKTLTYL